MTSSSDHRLALGYGSAWHLLRCLGWDRNRFSQLIGEVTGATDVTWLDSAASPSGKTYPSCSPVRDCELTRLAFINDADLQGQYDQFWPSRGSQQNWDAIGHATIAGRQEWVWLEAKAHIGEIHSSGTTAQESGGRPQIRKAFQETLEASGHEREAANSLAEAWLQGYYQHANRLATVHFLHEQGVSARLVFIYFYGDQWEGKTCPANHEAWESAVNSIHHGLNLKGTSDLERLVHDVYIDVDLKFDGSTFASWYCGDGGGKQRS